MVCVCLASTMLDSRVCFSSERQVEASAGFWWLRCVNALPDHMDSIVLGGWYPLTVALLLPPLLTHSICLFPLLFLTHSATLLHSALLETEIRVVLKGHNLACTSTYIPNERIMLLLLASVKADRCVRWNVIIGFVNWSLGWLKLMCHWHCFKGRAMSCAIDRAKWPLKWMAV